MEASHQFPYRAPQFMEEVFMEAPKKQRSKDPE